MTGILSAESYLGLDLESRTFLFLVVLGSDGLGFEGGCFLGFLAWYEGLGFDGGTGGSSLLVDFLFFFFIDA